MDPMRLVQVAGWLGSGKTTLIIALAKGLSRKGVKVAILVNEIGAIPVDGRVIQDYGLTVKDIGGGCICCQMAGSMMKTLKLLREGPNPDIVILEPTGIAVPHAVKEMVQSTAVSTGITLGPTIVLFDTTRAAKLLSYETLQRVITTQLQDADIIALSKSDAVTEESFATAGESVRIINPRAQIIRLSATNGDGMDALMRAAEEMAIPA
jgi:G3E family GTPase